MKSLCDDAVGSGNGLEGRGAARKPIASEAAPMLEGSACAAFGGRKVDCPHFFWGTCVRSCGSTPKRSSQSERSGPSNK